MTIQENVKLKDYSTMRLGGEARWLVQVTNDSEISELVTWAKKQQIPFIMIGFGANIVWRDEGFNGLVIVNRILGKEVLSEDTSGAIVKVGAGEVWDDVVAWTVQKNLSGIEFLSLIPGTAGAAPVQNIGAYGKELSSVLEEVGAYDTQAESFGTILAETCGFSYRDSRFKSIDRGRFLITSVTLRLSKTNPSPPFYESLDAYLKEHDISQFTPAIIRDAVIAIRRAKLPDPAKVASNGSFFVNPIVEQAKFEQLRQKYPLVKSWSAGAGRVKLSAGWLIEMAGFKGVHDQQTGMATWPTQALTLINEHAQHTSDLLAFKQKIIDKVKADFDIELVQEPELLP